MSWGVKTGWLAAMQKQQCAIHLRKDYGGLKAGMKPQKCAPFIKQPSKPPHTKSLPPNL